MDQYEYGGNVKNKSEIFPDENMLKFTVIQHNVDPKTNFLAVEYYFPGTFRTWIRWETVMYIRDHILEPLIVGRTLFLWHTWIPLGRTNRTMNQRKNPVFWCIVLRNGVNIRLEMTTTPQYTEELSISSAFESNPQFS